MYKKVEQAFEIFRNISVKIFLKDFKFYFLELINISKCILSYSKIDILNGLKNIILS